jgi:N-ethylmaleimide reductase
MSFSFLEPYHSELLGHLKNRVAMSAMTRGFADANHCCIRDIANYYIRRAEHGVGLILTEGAVVHPSADGYANVPHLFTNEQAHSWQETIEGVHKYKSKIFAQLWHCGRISHPDFTGGIQPVSSTNRPAEGVNRQNQKPFGVPRSLHESEIPEIIQMHIDSAEKAFAVGFDGVEIHMGHGYLIDQFLDARINDRNDAYGGSVENRCRFAIELAETLVKRFGANKVTIRISPSRFMGGLYEWPNLDEMIAYLLPTLNAVGLRIIDISCANANYFETSGKVIRNVREVWPHTILGGASLTPEAAENEVITGLLDVVTWGRFILANYDFVEKVQNNKKLFDMDDSMRSRLD